MNRHNVKTLRRRTIWIESLSSESVRDKPTVIDGIKNRFSLESKIPFDTAKIRLPDTVRFLLVQQKLEISEK